MRKIITKSHAQKIGQALHDKFVSSQDKGLLAKMIALYQSGKAIDEVAVECGKPLATTYRWIKGAGVEIRPRSAMKGKPWSAARRSATPEKEKVAAIVVDGIELNGRELRTYQSIGNKSHSEHGYITVNLGKKRKQYEHILIAEKALGRPLKRGEVVHHINCNKTDNRPENLLICTISYHLKLHARMRRHPYWSQL